MEGPNLTRFRPNPKSILLSMAVAMGFICCAMGVAVADTDDCLTGQYRNEATNGHCCWEGQIWGPIEKRCIGQAECPPGLLPSDDGEDCTPAECSDGLVDSGGGCCWPGQKWLIQGDSGRCSGTPKCPRGYTLRSSECLKLPPLPQMEKLSYVPVAEADYVLLKSGNYVRGSRRSEAGRFRNERAHQVFITRPVLFKKTEVTQREWRQLIPHNPSLFAACGLDCPVERINWYEALAWLNLLSEAEGLAPCYSLQQCDGALGGGCRAPGDDGIQCDGDYVCGAVHFNGLNCSGYRLPTEAEWEYAARSGSIHTTYAGPLLSESSNHAPVLNGIAWYAGNSAVDYDGGHDCSKWRGRLRPAEHCGTHPVGRKKPTPWGHFDLLGNVMEWVWDGFGLYARRSRVDPVRAVGLERVIRGGSWSGSVRDLRTALRSRLAPTGRNAMLGFRAVRTVQGPPVPGEKATESKSPEPAKAVETPVKKPVPATQPPPSGVPIKVEPKNKKESQHNERGQRKRKGQPASRRRQRAVKGVPLRVLDSDLSP
jgi:formylglycine-generating enzyme required for sulfatase activity